MIVKNPGGRHKRFRLMERDGGGYRTVVHPELDLINTDYLAGRLTPDRARLQLERLKERLEKERVKPVSWLPENMQIAEAFIQEELATRPNKRPKAASDRILWGVKQLGKTSLTNSTKADLVSAFSHLDVGGKRRAYSIVNSLLRFRGSNIRLKLPRAVRPEPEYITFEDLLLVLEAIPKREERIFCKASFGIGTRYGEMCFPLPLI